MYMSNTELEKMKYMIVNKEEKKHIHIFSSNFDYGARIL